MKKYSMLVGGSLIVAINVYGIIISALLDPPSLALTLVAAASITLILLIETRKRRVLLETRENESYLYFGLLIVFEVFFAISGCALMVYMSDEQLMGPLPDSRLRWLVAGYLRLPTSAAAAYNLPYYLLNFLLFMYYLRCFYVMFWSENIVFIYRYLKTKVKELNESLLANMPVLPYGPELKDTICSLCLEEYSKEERITRLHCTHIYHRDCIKVWVLRSNCCPLCRKRVIF